MSSNEKHNVIVGHLFELPVTTETKTQQSRHTGKGGRRRPIGIAEVAPKAFF